MTEATPNDVLAQYRSISNKLKKRFLRKPNVQEASEQYGVLAQLCESQELRQYAGLCWQAVARCENELGHAKGEVTALVRGGHQFLQAEQKGSVMGCPSAGGENLQASLSCFSCAGLRSQYQGPLGLPTAASLALELGCILQSELDRPEAAQDQFSRAADLQRSHPLAHLLGLGLVASSKLEQGDYDGALAVFSEMSSIAQCGPQPPLGAYCDILHRCEVTQVLLLLLLQPTPQRLSPPLGHLLEKYTWGEYSQCAVELVSEELFLLLQSLVMASQSQDMPSLCTLEADLWHYLTAEQRTLLRTLVSSISRGI